MLFFNLRKLPVAVVFTNTWVPRLQWVEHPSGPACPCSSVLMSIPKQMFWLCTRIPTSQRLAAASLVSQHKFLLGLRKARCQHLGRSFCDLCSCNFLLNHYMIPFFLLLLLFSHLSFQGQGSTCSRRYKIFFLLQFSIRSHFLLVFKSLVYNSK